MFFGGCPTPGGRVIAATTRMATVIVGWICLRPCGFNNFDFATRRLARPQRKLILPAENVAALQLAHKRSLTKHERAANPLHNGAKRFGSSSGIG